MGYLATTPVFLRKRSGNAQLLLACGRIKLRNVIHSDGKLGVIFHGRSPGPRVSATILAHTSRIRRKILFTSPTGIQVLNSETTFVGCRAGTSTTVFLKYGSRHGSHCIKVL